MIVYDASNAVAGRLAAVVAKKLIQGEEVVVVNSEKAVFSGPADRLIKTYYKRRGQRNMSNPEHSAKWPRRPDLFYRRVVIGMLPKNTSRGRIALSKFRAYMGVPKEYEGKAEKFKSDASKLKCKQVTVLEICEALGWKTN